MPVLDSNQILRFGDFELDVAAYELRRRGRPVKLGRQPMDLLILLVEHRRQLVSRGEIVERLWGKDVFVDVDTGVNTAISKIRQALRDSAEAPAFVETVPGKGYRFVAPVDVVPLGPRRVQWSSSRRGGRGARTDGGASTRTRRFVMASNQEDTRACRDRRARVGGCGKYLRVRPNQGWRSDDRHAGGLAVREPRQRSGACVPGRRPDRRDQRVARSNRSRPPQRQGADAALQGDDDVGRRNRPRARVSTIWSRARFAPRAPGCASRSRSSASAISSTCGRSHTSASRPACSVCSRTSVRRSRNRSACGCRRIA